MQRRGAGAGGLLRPGKEPPGEKGLAQHRGPRLALVTEPALLLGPPRILQARAHVQCRLPTLPVSPLLPVPPSQPQKHHLKAGPQSALARSPSASPCLWPGSSPARRRRASGASATRRGRRRARRCRSGAPRLRKSCRSSWCRPAHGECGTGQGTVEGVMRARAWFRMRCRQVHGGGCDAGQGVV